MKNKPTAEQLLREKEERVKAKVRELDPLDCDSGLYRSVEKVSLEACRRLNAARARM